MVPLSDFDSTSCLRVAVIGGGAAGFFAAISTAELNPSAEVVLFESGKKVLRKVKVSGGGRCNLTHSCFEPADLAQKYPRGGRELRGAFTIGNPVTPSSGSGKRACKPRPRRMGVSFRFRMIRRPLSIASSGKPASRASRFVSNGHDGDRAGGRRKMVDRVGRWQKEPLTKSASQPAR